MEMRNEQVNLYYINYTYMLQIIYVFKFFKVLNVYFYDDKIMLKVYLE